MRSVNSVLALLIVASWHASAIAADAVYIESKQVPACADSVKVGIYLSNDDVIRLLSVPLVVRSLDSGAFIRDHFSLLRGGRVAAFESTDVMTSVHYCDMSGKYWTSYHECPRSSSTWEAWDPSIPPAFTSPDAVLYACVSLSNEAYIDVGSDSAYGVPSMQLSFGVTCEQGRFEIDTTCVPPAAHVGFYGGFWGEVESIPFVTKGIIEIGCECDCHTDPQCDGYHDIIDWMKIRNVAQGSSGPIPDPNPFCPFVTTDVNCDGVTNNTDKNLMYGVIFLGDDPDSVFCDPCP